LQYEGFVEMTKAGFGIRSKGRKAIGTGVGFQLREPVACYRGIFPALKIAISGTLIFKFQDDSLA